MISITRLKKERNKRKSSRRRVIAKLDNPDEYVKELEELVESQAAIIEEYMEKVKNFEAATEAAKNIHKRWNIVSKKMDFAEVEEEEEAT